MATSLPAAAYLSDAGRTVPEMKSAFDAQRNFIANMIGGAVRQAVTIASGTVTPGDGTSGGAIIVDTEAAAASDDLANIALTNVPDGMFLYIFFANASRVVTVKHNAGGSGQIQLVNSADFVGDALDKWLLLQRRSTTMVEVARSYGVDYYDQQDFMRIASVPAHDMLCPHARLRIDYASASSVAVAADAVVLSDSAGHLKRFNSLSKTLNIANTGANGRDIVDNAGAEQSSSWYHIFAIGKDDGTLDVFASQVGYPGSGTSIYTRLPSGYAWAGYLGAVRNDGSSNLWITYQRGSRVTQTGSQPLSSGTATSYTSIDLSSHIPQTAFRISGSAYALSTSGSPSCNFTLAAIASNSVGKLDFYFPSTSVSNGTGGPFKLDLVNAQAMVYFKSTGSTNVSILLTGWEY